MKKKILIVFFGLIFCLGVYFAFNREPKVDAGRITITVNEKEKGIELPRNIYDVEKTGTANIVRNAEKNTLTLITCRHNTNKQIVIICELI